MKLPGIVKFKRVSPAAGGISNSNRQQVRNYRSAQSVHANDNIYSKKSGGLSTVASNNFKNKSATSRDIANKKSLRSINTDGLSSKSLDSFNYNR